MSKSIFYILLLVIVSPLVLTAQKRERIKYKADQMEFMRINNEPVRKLKYNVLFTQEGTKIYCDSSYFFPDHNRMEAYGRVKIIDDSVTITAKKLIYEGAERKALLRQDVVYTSGTKVLYTDFLDYDLVSKVGTFFNKGKLVDDSTTLTSEKGVYFSAQNYAIFRNDVLLVSPQYTLRSDTLNYNTTTKLAVTPGPTRIITPDGVVLDAQGGEYLTERMITEFDRGEVETRDYILEGDRMFLDDLDKFYTAKGNVKMTAKNRDIIIIGEEGQHFKALGYSKIYGNPVMKKIMELDTFYLSADTLYAIESEVQADKRILAYNNVKMFKWDLQGKSDSLAYFLADSTIQLYNDPILWTNNSQITADSIRLILVENVLDQMILRKNSFISSQDSIKQFNQIKGRDMVAQFRENQMEQINVEGNGESIYYILDETDTVLVGLNRMICANMLIQFKENEIENITFYKNPEAKLIPPHEITPKDKALDGFSWRIAERPELYDVAHYLKPLGSDSLKLEVKKPIKLKRDSLNQEENRPPEEVIRQEIPNLQLPEINNEQIEQSSIPLEPEGIK